MIEQTRVPQQAPRLAVLEAYRGLCALMVVALHALGRKHTFFLFEAHLAVDMFLMLSGYILAYKYEAGLQQGAISFRHFIANRLIRLWPLVIIGILLGTAVEVVLDKKTTLEILTGFATGIFMLPNFLLGFQGTVFPLNFALWSLFFEMVASVAFGLFLFRMSTTGLVWLVVASAAIVIVYAKWMGSSIDYGFNWKHFLLGFPRLTIAFIFGVIVFQISKSVVKTTVPFNIANLDIFAICALFTALAFAGGMHKGNNSFEIFTILFVLPLLLFIGAWSKSSGYRVQVYCWLGLISFPIYVLHVPLIKLMKYYSPNFFAMRNTLDWLEFGVFFAGLIVLAHVVGRYVDAPVRSWLKRRFFGRPVAPQKL